MHSVVRGTGTPKDRDEVNNKLDALTKIVNLAERFLFFFQLIGSKKLQELN